MTNKKVNIDKLAEQFWEDGYLVLPEFFPLPQMAYCQNVVSEHFGDKPSFVHDSAFIEQSKTEVIPWFPQREGDTTFNETEANSTFNALTNAILGEQWQPQYCMVMYSSPDSKGQAWHQDCPPEAPAHFNLNRLVYTMDITDETGGEVYIRPGTHKNSVLTAGELFEDFSDQVVVRPKQGTLILLHGHCWHRVGRSGGKARISTNFRAVPAGVSDDITDICVYRNMRYQFSTQQVISTQ